MSLNESQAKIAETLEGMIVVDAGPGTGKTHTVVARCINIMRKKDFTDKDLIMLTFTKNAAAEMRERVQSNITKMFKDRDIDKTEFNLLTELAKKMNIGTFDSFCLSIVKSAPGAVSKFFNMNEVLSRKADITENDSLNNMYFRRFLDRFMDEKGEEFGDAAALIANEPTKIYALLNRLMARGILPCKTKSGTKYWFGMNEGKELVGDVEKLREVLNSFHGLKKEQAMRFTDVPDAKDFDLTSKDPVPEMLDLAAEDDRTELINIIHEIFYDYIRQSIADDRLTFGLVASFAFVVLYSEDKVRKDISTEYLIVDEFQDTNSNQLMICLMILNNPNLCVVGDWKQGIYGFRYVSIENITDFDNKVKTLKEFLNDDKIRVDFTISEVKYLPLKENYRSSQTIIDAAYETLYIPGDSKEELDSQELSSHITPIVSKREEIGQYTGIECIKCETRNGEIEETLRCIQRYHDSGEFLVIDGEGCEPRTPNYSDIAILCRDTKFCRTIYEACREHKIPAFLQGDICIMSTMEGKLLLAWLRYISNDNDPWGISAILAHEGYSYYEIEKMIHYDFEAKKSYVPENLQNFKNSLRRKRRRITELISSIFGYYGWDNDVTQAITAILSGTHRNTLVTIQDLIRTIENDIEMETRYDVDGLPESDAIIIQSMHKSKGLEYPIVIIPHIDSKSFPLYPKEKDFFSFDDLAGIRCNEEIIHFGNEKKQWYSWKTAVVRKSQKADYSEERRLFFVAISRAKQYITMISAEPSPFYKNFAEKYREQPEGSESITVGIQKSEILIEKPIIPAFAQRRKNLSGHDLMRFDPKDKRVVEGFDELCPKGPQYGTKIHKLAELLVKGITIDEKTFEEYPELPRVKSIIDRLRAEGAELSTEVDCFLPLNEINVTISGRIDLVAIFNDRIEVHDWKTDVDQSPVEEYAIQLSIYAKALQGAYGKKAKCFIDWVSLDKVTEFEPYADEKLIERAKEFLTIHREK